MASILGADQVWSAHESWTMANVIPSRRRSRGVLVTVRARFVFTCSPRISPTLWKGTSTSFVLTTAAQPLVVICFICDVPGWYVCIAEIAPFAFAAFPAAAAVPAGALVVVVTAGCGAFSL